MMSLKFVLEAIQEKNSLINALKKNDINAAKKAIVDAMKNKRPDFGPENELGIEKSEYQELTKALHQNDINAAKKAIGMEGQYQMRGPDVDPKTGQMWGNKPNINKLNTSKLNKEEMKNLVDVIHDYELGQDEDLDDVVGDIIDDYKNNREYDLKNLKINRQDFDVLDRFIQKYFDNKQLDKNELKLLQQVTYKFWKTFQQELGLEEEDFEVLDLI